MLLKQLVHGTILSSNVSMVVSFCFILLIHVHIYAHKYRYLPIHMHKYAHAYIYNFNSESIHSWKTVEKQNEKNTKKSLSIISMRVCMYVCVCVYECVCVYVYVGCMCMFMHWNGAKKMPNCTERVWFSNVCVNTIVFNLYVNNILFYFLCEYYSF
jgi:hypothetical protein